MRITFLLGARVYVRQTLVFMDIYKQKPKTLAPIAIDSINSESLSVNYNFLIYCCF